ncbi:hypothetical protein LINPERPRIM_LOCUS14979 [Linum perenne]
MRGRYCTWRFYIFRSKLLSVKRRIATFFVSGSLAVRVSRRVLEPRLLVSLWLQEGGPANVGSPLIDEQVDGSTNVGSSNEGRTGG